MTFKELTKNIKFWMFIGAAAIGGLGALGMQYDAPAWVSQLQPIQHQVGMNQRTILQMQIYQLTRAIWDQQDRLKMNPNPDGELRLRELLEQRARLESELKILIEQKGG